MFTSLGPDARDILGVVAFLPQGVNEVDIDRIFPTVPTIHQILDTFSILSLTHRNQDFITTYAPLREYLSTIGDPGAILSYARDYYLSRMRAVAHQPSLQDVRWLISEEANIETMLALSTRCKG